MKTFFLRWKWWFIILSPIFVIVGATAWGGNDILSPVRRTTKGYESWLDSPEIHGVRVECSSVVIYQTEVPFLCVEPDFTSQLGERGKVIQEQLREHGELPAKEIVGTCVLFHGHKGRKEFLLPVVERFCAMGFRCLVPDLPAHGEHPEAQVNFGHGAAEADYLAALLSTLDEKESEQAVHVWGMSMGGSFALQNVAKHQERVASLTLLCTFMDLDSVMQVKTQSYIGSLGEGLHAMTRFFHDHFGEVDLKAINNESVLSEIEVPTLVIHGNADDFIPDDHGKRIFQGISSKDKHFYTVEGAGHYDLLITPQLVYKEMLLWMLNKQAQ